MYYHGFNTGARETTKIVPGTHYTCAYVFNLMYVHSNVVRKSEYIHMFAGHFFMSSECFTLMPYFFFAKTCNSQLPNSNASPMNTEVLNPQHCYVLLASIVYLGIVGTMSRAADNKT